jgi:DNA-binding NarL/FixJ family response regulator
LYQESLAIGRELSDKLCIAFVLNMLGDISFSQNEDVRAAALFEESFSVAQELGSKELIGWSLTGLAAAKGGEELQEKVIQRFESAWAQRRSITAEQALAAQGDAVMPKRLFVAPRSRPYRHPIGGFFQVAQSEVVPTINQEVTYPEGQTAREVEVLRLAAQGLTDLPIDVKLAQPKQMDASPSGALSSPSLTPHRALKQLYGGLSAREREVACLVAQGKSNRAIAEELVVGVSTVEAHITHILCKLVFSSRAQIAAWAVDRGLVQVQQDVESIRLEH